VKKKIKPCWSEWSLAPSFCSEKVEPYKEVIKMPILSSGSYGTVHLVSADRVVKLLHDKMSEAVVVRELGLYHLVPPHPRLLFPVGIEYDRRLLMKMPYADKTLNECIRIPLEEEQICQVLLGVAEGLSHLHTYGVMHRDVKPDNIFCVDGLWKLGDFSLCRTIPVAGGELISEEVFAVSYRAPEALCGKSCGPEADMWALGVVLLEMIEGDTAFEYTGTEYSTLVSVGKRIGYAREAGFFPEYLPYFPTRPASQTLKRRVLGSIQACLDGLLRSDPSKRWTAKCLVSYLKEECDDLFHKRYEGAEVLSLRRASLPPRITFEFDANLRAQGHMIGLCYGAMMGASLPTQLNAAELLDAIACKTGDWTTAAPVAVLISAGLFEPRGSRIQTVTGQMSPEDAVRIVRGEIYRSFEFEELALALGIDASGPYVPKVVESKESDEACSVEEEAFSSCRSSDSASSVLLRVVGESDMNTVRSLGALWLLLKMVQPGADLAAMVEFLRRTSDTSES
jgi:hypothetical protein